MATDERNEPDHEADLVKSDALAAPDEHTFWNTYSPRFEMPISYVASALILVSFLGLLALVASFALGTSDRKGAVMGVVGDDDFGEGSPGEGGTENPITQGEKATIAEEIKNILPLDQTLPQVKADLQKQFDFDKNSPIPIADQNAASISALDKSIQDKLYGQKKGTGGPGSQGDGGQGSGPGGTGSDSTRARSLRWIMRFKTAGGRDYLNQLSSLGAEVVVPLVTDPKQAHLFSDLSNPKPGTMMTDKDWARLGGQIQFMDHTRKSVLEVSEALNLDFTPKVFMAFFPRDLEDKLSRMERGYQNRRSEDIDETVFEVIFRGGKYEMIVASQKIKR